MNAPRRATPEITERESDQNCREWLLNIQSTILGYGPYGSGETFTPTTQTFTNYANLYETQTDKAHPYNRRPAQQVWPLTKFITLFPFFVKKNIHLPGGKYFSLSFLQLIFFSKIVHGERNSDFISARRHQIKGNSPFTGSDNNEQFYI